MSKKIILKSSDGELFEVDEAVARESEIIKLMIKDDCIDNGIPVPNATSLVLAKVIEYCKKHVEAAADEANAEDTDLKAWDADFVKVDQSMLFDIMLAAKYLCFNGLLDLTCKTVTDHMMKGITPEQIPEDIFEIMNDYTPEKEPEEEAETPAKKSKT